ncbi:PREDICTED: UDP-glucuronosyltransferase 2B13-like [Rhagoletis zephyria]|uniref:UDP-glucuronosyltransferase 2B13-like n=1 Tax=Rhagoletis zephyria TaxID=28612 RepID=UPI00081133D4|nr:PREDICTED: UDP-glucuronosyltransferase 2B13-like [Rhagoletis zephyria]
MQLRWLLFCVAALLMPLNSAAFNILFMGPFPAPSHWMWLEHFLRDLLERGHHVTAVTNHRSKYPHENLTEIIIEPKFDIPYYFPKDNIFKMRFSNDFQNLQMWWHVGLLTSEHALNDPKVKSLIASKDLEFDLMVLEQFFHESFLMFAHKFKCPVVTLGTMGYADNMDHAMGLLTPWSFVPHLLLSHTDQMTFTQRAYNTYLSLYDVVMRRWHYMPRMQEMAEKHFSGFIEGPLPNVRQLEKNISMMFINSHRSLDVPRPTISGLLNVAGVHIKKAKPLPHDIQSFLDNSTHGVVYFSMGSYVKSTDMPQDKISLILSAFSQLKQDVLWKFENSSIGQLPPNVKIQSWLPQNDILAHPNIKVFITHGGLFGTQEGIYWGVPMLCIPLYGDQHRNTIKSVRGGYARSLNFGQMTSEDLVLNVQLLISDSSYKQKALEASRKFRDNPMHPLDEASFWMEYVARHKGAPHLKSAGAYMPLYQYLLLDVFGCALLVAVLAIWLPLKFLKVVRNLLKRKEKVSPAADASKKRQ